MKIACICCTLRRPLELANAVACFLAQDYPAELRELIILDDDPDPESGWQNQAGNGWRIVRTLDRSPNLGHKHNRLAELAAETDADAIAIWDDDDIYAPWHLSAMAAALRVSRWAAPSIVWSNYHKTRGVPLVAEVATGRFHGAWGCRLEAWEACGGWPNTERQTFDQEFGQRLAMLGKPSDPCMFERPSYVYRWNGGNVSGIGEGWHGRMLEMRPTTTPGQLHARFDDETVNVLRKIGA
jgi:glycosyltransferase involved in cell wall biosynthesis